MSKREVFGWAMYDFANSGYTKVVMTAAFNAYFVGVVAGGADWGTLAWTPALGASNAVVMFSMPAIGAHADRRAPEVHSPQDRTAPRKIVRSFYSGLRQARFRGVPPRMGRTGSAPEQDQERQT